MSTKSPISRTKPYFIFIPLVVSVLLLMGCTLSVPISPTLIQPIPTSAGSLPTQTSILSSPTPLFPTTTSAGVLLTLTAILPSPTTQPIAATSVAAMNIVFTTGTTAEVRQGTVQPGQVVTYTLAAGASQPMVLILDSPGKDVTLGVYEPNGTMLLDPANKYTRWQWLLPRTEVYTIQVIGGASTENYTLTVKVAQILNFASGASSMTLSGKTINGFVFSYALSAKAGQTMTVSLNVPSTTAYLDVFGIATGVLLSPTAKATTWTGVLPQTQEYVIEVIPNNGQVVSYSITISIPPTSTPLPTSTPAPAFGNIVFTTGTTAAVRQGTIQPGQVVSYNLSAGQLQPIILILESPNSDVTLGVREPDGNYLVDPAKKWNRWQAWLPKTEVYTIQVIGGASTENYTLTVKVAQLVNFASGATSITLSGKTINGFVFSYALSAKKGQTMTVSLNVPSTTAYLDVFGIATGVLLSPTAKATSWTGVLPQTQEYVIEVIPNNGQVVNYSIIISIP